MNDNGAADLKKEIPEFIGCVKRSAKIHISQWDYFDSCARRGQKHVPPLTHPCD